MRAVSAVVLVDTAVVLIDITRVKVLGIVYR
jgi:hypothetical protein